MNRNARSFRSKFDSFTQFARTNMGKVGAAGTALLASGGAFAQSTSPGAAIAAELSGGKSDVMLVIAAAAVIIGVLVLWAYVKRAR